MGDAKFKKGDYVEYKSRNLAGETVLLRGFVSDTTRISGGIFHYVQFTERYYPHSDQYEPMRDYDWIKEEHLSHAGIDLKPEDYEAMYALLIDPMLLRKDIESCKALRKELDQRLSQLVDNCR